MKTYQHYIGGHYVDPIGGQWFDSIDPYRGEAWARIPRGCARTWTARWRQHPRPCARARGPR